MISRTSSKTHAARAQLAQSRSVVGILLLLSFVFLGGSRCGLETQAARHYAADGQAIAELVSAANPVPELSPQHPLPGTVPGRVRVAVIDNGVDYMHPELTGRVSFGSIHSTELRAGFDALGDDNWAHPNLIDPSVFAFGAEVAAGKIRNPLADPLRELSRLNQLFLDRLFAALNGHDLLQNSLFRRLNGPAISVLGAHVLLNIVEFDPEYYARLREEGLLKNDEFFANPANFDSYLDWDKWMAREEWVLDSQSGTPRFAAEYSLPEALWDIEHADIFHELLSEVYQGFIGETGFDDLLRGFVNYRRAFESESDVPDDLLLQPLQLALFQHDTNFAESDPSLAYVRALCESLPLEMLSFLQEPGLDPEERQARVTAAFDTVFAMAARLNQTVLDSPRDFTDTLVNGAELNQRLLDRDRSDLQRFIQQKGTLNFSCQDLATEFAGSEAFAEFRATYNHPYLSQENTAAHHGTHVAGLVITQDPRIDVVPVRVSTQGLETSAERRAALLERFMNDFSAWIASPVFHEGSDRLFQEVFPEIDNPQQRAALFLERVRPLMKVEIENDALELIFMEDIVEAIAYVGSEKVKVANVSLGTSFAAAPTSPISVDPLDKIPAFFKFLRFEYFKHKVALAVLTEAPHTLFVIAAGNDGNWVDGKSRSALPCDLSSPYFSKFEQEDQRIPNSVINNVLCVGSLNANDELSSFSNLPITQVPFVLSYGESILSTIRTGNCDGAFQDLDSRLSKKIWFASLPVNAPTVELAIELGFLTEDDRFDDGKAFLALSKLNTLLNNTVSGFRQAERSSHCVTNTRQVARLTGTSMATPAVAGFVAQMVAAELERSGQVDTEVWEEEHFSPQRLISRLKEGAPAYGGDSLIAEVKKIIDVNEWLSTSPARSLFSSLPQGTPKKQSVFLFPHAPR